MKFVLFYHSLLSDWNHGNAHFLRGIASELVRRGNEVVVMEPEDSWSYRNLLADADPDAIREFDQVYPSLTDQRYGNDLNLESALQDADVVIVHEWNEPELVCAIGEHHEKARHYKLLFHDTHHRAVTARDVMARYDMRFYDGALVYGALLREIYIQEQWVKRVWTWHEAADTHVFHPLVKTEPVRDLVWIGNWGDEERTEELHEFLIGPVKALKLKATVYGVRFPDQARAALAEAGIEYGGYLPNYRAPQAFAESRVTVHVPRRPYVRQLPGIPTIRPFEALACGIPLISAPWNDTENLFNTGRDYLIAADGNDMRHHLSSLLGDNALAQQLSESGLRTITARHTCKHRAEQLSEILDSIQPK